VAANGEPGEGDVGGGDAELMGCQSDFLEWSMISIERLWRTSLLPRPNPLTTGPRSFKGNGACGVSGPAIGSRGASGRPIMK
jgi:hypothetical protein